MATFDDATILTCRTNQAPNGIFGGDISFRQGRLAFCLFTRRIPSVLA
jgi:hypothetical protein